LIIRHIRLKGCKEAKQLSPQVIVYGPQDETVRIHLVVNEIVARPGKKLVKRLIFVDQFGDEHVSKKIEILPGSTFHLGQKPTSSSCFFCREPIDLKDVASDAAVPAHVRCIWS